MRVVTEQTDFDDEQMVGIHDPVRLGRTDAVRGAMVILIAVAIGALIISRGLDAPDGGPTTAAADVEPGAPEVGADEGITGADEVGTTVGAATEGSGDAPSGGLTGGETADSGAATAGGVGTETTTDTTTVSTTVTAAAPPAIRSPAEVLVLVLNAGGPQGIAGRGTEMVQAMGYQTSAAKNADITAPSAIYYIEGYEAEARAVSAVFGPGLETLVVPLDPANSPSADLQGAAVIVVVGDDDAIPVV